MSASLPMRPYQDEALAAIDERLAGGLRRLLLVLPTGTGKTVTFAQFLGQRPGRALVLVHRQELLTQAAATIAAICPDRTVALEWQRNSAGDAEIAIAMVQTLAAGDGARAERIGQFDTVVIDEAHHGPAETYQRVLAAVAGPDTVVLGVTATPDRADGVGLGTVFEEIAYERDLAWAVREGYCADVRAKAITIGADLNNIAETAGDFDQGALSRSLMAARAPEIVAAAIAREAHHRPTLLFCASLEMSRATAKALAARYLRTAHLDGSVPADERAAILERFRTRDLDVVTNVEVLTEGFDDPHITCVCVARPTISRSLYTQMIGRGLRLFPGKREALVLDLVGATERAGLVGAASLLGQDMLEAGPRPDLEAEARIQELLRWTGEPPLAAEDIELLSAHFEQASRTLRPTWEWRQPKLISLEGYGWHAVLPGGAEVQLVQYGKAGGADAWGPVVVYPERTGRQCHPIVAFDHPLPLELAFGAAEDWIAQHGAEYALRSNRVWRLLPALEKQVEGLRQRGLPWRPQMTRGQAVDAGKAPLSREPKPKRRGFRGGW